MDPSRPLLLGVLIALGACASWTPGAARHEPTNPTAFEPAGSFAADCTGTPDVRAVGQRALFVDGCAPRVAIYRRDVLGGGGTVLIGSCRLPCADEPGDGVYAYSFARLTDGLEVGNRCEETFVSLEDSTAAR